MPPGPGRFGAQSLHFRIKKKSGEICSMLCAGCSRAKDSSGWTANTVLRKIIMVAVPSRILVFSLRRFGDLLLTTPLSPSLHRAWPESEVDVLTFANTAGLVAANPDINRVITIPERPTTAESMRLLGHVWRRYDIAISTHSGDRPTVYAFAAGKLRVGVTTGDDPLL